MRTFREWLKDFYCPNNQTAPTHCRGHAGGAIDRIASHTGLGFLRGGRSLVSYSIGRDGANDIVIEDISVSRRHAHIEDLGDGRYVLFDLGSANGCFVEQSDDWQQFGEAEVQSTEPLMLGEYQTTARDLIRRISKPRPPGVTVMAAVDETQRTHDQPAAVEALGSATPAAGESLRSVWLRLPEYQKIAAIVSASVLGLLIVSAIVIGLLGGL